MDTISFEYPSEDDWTWITEQHIDTAWASLTPESQMMILKQTLRDCMVEQIFLRKVNM